MSSSCNCCKGIEPITPVTERNRPGLDSLVYRVGTYATFFETMKAGLSSADLAALAALRTRDSADPSIALLDAWSLIADVLTFYQERIANEGYLRTATERRSILELARLVGYRLRPGVAASTYLAYTLDPGSEVTIAAGARAQSVPGPGELPQSFETADSLPARAAWNNLGPRQVQPQIITPASPVIYFDGTNANLKANDYLLLDAGSSQAPTKVAASETDFTKSRTEVTLQVAPKAAAMKKLDAANPGAQSPFDSMLSSVAPLTKPPADHPRNSLQLSRSVKDLFALQADTIPSLLTTFHPEIDRKVYAALKNAPVTPDPAVNVYAFRVQASPFGNNAPLKPILDSQGKVIGTEEWPLADSISISMSAVFVGVVPTPQEPSLTAGLFRRRAATQPSMVMTVNVKQGAESASASFNLDQTVHKVAVGKWELDITEPDSTSLATVKFEFSTVPKRSFTVSGAGGSLSVAVDGATVVQCPLGQAVSSSDAGHSLSISFLQDGKSILIVDEQDTPSSQPNVVLLDSTYDQILPGSWAILERAGHDPKPTQVVAIEKISATSYGLSAKVTKLTLKDNWLDPDKDVTLAVARETSIYAQSEKLPLAEEPIDDDVSGARIELDDLYAGLLPGRWLIVQGERTEIKGVTSAELVMLSGVEQDVQTLPAPAATESPTDYKPAMGAEAPAAPPAETTPTVRPGDQTHSFLVLAKSLAYTYKRDTVNIFGNVVRATHGETRNELLGNGDASQELQSFALHQSPLTYVAATTPEGTQSTLQVRVNEVLWHEVDTLADLGPSDRKYVTQTDDAGKTSVIFGTGKHGARLPSGNGNVSAAYRSGIGSPGNVAAQQISQLSTRPLGVRAVINPLPATGGADKDARDQARRNAPIGVTALDRLVSVQDYSDFARTFAGIGKASAAQLSDGHRQLVCLTIAGNEDIPIAKESDLYNNLMQALRTQGDPHQSFAVAMREVLLLVISAKVQVMADYQWESVEPMIRARMLDVFSFDNRDLGEDVRLSEIISTIQQIPGVNYVDVDLLDSISENDAKPGSGKDAGSPLRAKLTELTAPRGLRNRIPIYLARPSSKGNGLLPAQLAYLSPDVPDTLILTEIPQ